jgi:hypothetical protein
MGDRGAHILEGLSQRQLHQEITRAEFEVRRTAAEFREAEGRERAAAERLRIVAEERERAAQQLRAATQRIEILQRYMIRGVKRDRSAGAQLRSPPASLLIF